MDEFNDSISAINKSIVYAFSPDKGKGVYALIEMDNKSLVGAAVVNYSGMDEYIPGVFLVYIAVKESYRSMGIGSKMIKQVIEKNSGSIALHVENNNPVKDLYVRLGFVSKYAEMRYERD